MNGGGTWLDKENSYCVPLCQERRDKKNQRKFVSGLMFLYLILKSRPVYHFINFSLTLF